MVYFFNKIYNLHNYNKTTTNHFFQQHENKTQWIYYHGSITVFGIKYSTLLEAGTKNKLIRQINNFCLYRFTDENSSQNNEMLWEKLIVQNKSVSNNDMP